MKKVVFSFGRMNPPTSGHQKLVTKVKTIAKQQNADARIYLSHSQNKKKDPLDYNTKINIAKKAFGSIVTTSGSKTIVQILQELERVGYTDITMVVGSDRVKGFKDLLTKYNGKDYAFNSIRVMSAGQRDPDADDVSGMSASKMRALAVGGDFNSFKAGLPKNAQSMAKQIFDKLRSIMEEENKTEEQLDERVLTLQQRKARARLMKRLAKKMARQRSIRKKRMADAGRLEKRARKQAIKLLRKKVAGERGQDYAKLASSERMSIDKLVDKKSAIIGKLAKRLLPKVRKAEVARVSKARTTTEETQMMTESKKTFRSMFGEASMSPNEDRVKQDIAKEKDSDKVKHDRMRDNAAIADARFRAKMTESLERKAEEAGIPFEIVVGVYYEGVAAYDRTKEGTIQQQAFQAVNSFIANMEEAKKDDLKGACWKGYKAVGLKDKNGKKVPNCVPVSEAYEVHVSDGRDYGEEPHTDDQKHFHASVKKHGGKVVGQTDSGARLHFKSARHKSNFMHDINHNSPKKSLHAEEFLSNSKLSFKEFREINNSLQIDEALEVKLRGGKVPVGQHRFKYDVDKSDKYIENSIKERDKNAKVERKGKDLWVTASAQAHSSVIAGLRQFRVDGTISEEVEIEEALKTDTKLRMAHDKKKRQLEKMGKSSDEIKKSLKMNFPSMYKEEVEIDEGKIIATDYQSGHEVSKFNGGYRPHIAHKKTGKTMYLGSVSYKKKEHAKAHADAYLKGYSQNGEYGANKDSNEYQRTNKKHIKEETEGLQKKNLKSILSRKKEAKSNAGAGEWGTDELVNKYVQDTPGMSITKVEGYCPDTGKLMEELIVENAEYEGKSVTLNNPFRLPAGSKKKFGVYVKNDKGNVVKVTFGDPNMEIKRDDPERRKNFRARHQCDSDRGPKWKARYWSCYQWRAGKKVDN